MVGANQLDDEEPNPTPNKKSTHLQNTALHDADWQGRTSYLGGKKLPAAF